MLERRLNNMKAFYNFEITKKDGKKLSIENAVAFELTQTGFFFYRLDGELTVEKPGSYQSDLKWLRLEDISEISIKEVKQFESKLDRENYEVALGIKDAPSKN